MKNDVLRLNVWREMFDFLHSARQTNVGSTYGKIYQFGLLDLLKKQRICNGYIHIEVRKLIIKWHLRGFSHAKIADLVECSRSTVFRTIKKYLNTGSVRTTTKRENSNSKFQK